MTKMTAYREGVPCWVDLAAPDAERAMAFYQELFGWEYADTGEQGGHYRMALKHGTPVAGISPEPGAGKTHWTTYLAADDIDAVAGRVRDAGGQVLDGPLDVPQAGRWAMAKDPAGAMFGLWQAGGHIGSGLANEPGTFTWNENLSTDPRAVRAFYHQVFGYEYDEIPGMDYTVIKLHGAPVGGIGEQPPMIPPGTPSFWTTYFHVGDTDLTTAQITELGGQVLVPPTDSPYGRMAVARDDGGASFCVIAPPRG
ncbi:VOC family protein [Kitasatospora acidiphila]|uniref:VOC family protein n=1 Tax=Kitasatospora acidiphila TaxID=2567942 RepID=A0A540WEF2_9ACTN|nr:VOC family protein [Kitasatospora acidiphila]TQF06784.1 VOC family protein [Kitasatospora acidiphila]